MIAASTILRLAAPERRYSPPRRREPSAEHRALLAQLHALAVAGVPFERRVRPLDQTVDNDESPKQSKRKQMAMGLDIRCPRGVRGEKGSRGIDAPNGAVGGEQLMEMATSQCMLLLLQSLVEQV